MLRPGAGLFDWAALLSLGSAVLYGFSQLMARKIGDTESSTVMAFYQNGAYLVGAAVVAGTFRLAGITHAVHPSLEFLVRPWRLADDCRIFSRWRPAVSSPRPA